MQPKLCRGVIHRVLQCQRKFSESFLLLHCHKFKRSNLLPALLLSPASTVMQDAFVVVEIECYFKCKLVELLVSHRYLGGKTKYFFDPHFVWHCLSLKPNLSQKTSDLCHQDALHSTNVL